MVLNIITTTFNDGKNIAQTADSILEISKNRPDLLIRWVIIDNVSSDNTSKIVKEVKFKHIVYKLLIEPDNGVYDAMNKGLDMCKEGHVLFLGAGDKIISLPKVLDSAVVYYGSTIIGNGEYYVSSIEHYCVTEFGTLHHQSMLAPVSFHRYFNLNYKICADYAHNIEMLVEGREFKFDPDLLAYQLPGGISSNLELVKSERAIIQQRVKDFVENGVLPDRI
jgi:putative colanic acid biosynthesis glycosyltransferase